jgi:deoxyribodipyrimidine photo-lyase
VLSFCEKLRAHDIYANLEYEVDELRRDIELHKISNSKAIEAHFVHDKCIIEPGTLLTKQDKAYSVREAYFLCVYLNFS